MADLEVWKSVTIRKGYEVSNFGRVRSLDRLVEYVDKRRSYNKREYLHKGRILRPQNGPSGYLTVHLGYKHMNKYIHHLVMGAFVGKTPKGLEICHNDGNKKNNRLDNLRFDTHWSNNFDRERHRYEQAWLNHVKDTKLKQGRHS